MPEFKDRLLRFFAFDHLPAGLRDVSAPFAVLADRIVEELPQNPERTVALRKLLEAKDCAVRCFIEGAVGRGPNAEVHVLIDGRQVTKAAVEDLTEELRHRGAR